MTNIFLNNNKGFSWFRSKNISIKGCFFDIENNFYEKEKLISFFEGVSTPVQFIAKIKETNGFFTVIIKVGNCTYMASDTTRIFPLFYTLNENHFSVSDDIEFLKKSNNLTEIDKQSAKEFESLGHTMGNKTLLKNIYQLQSSEYLIFKKNTLIKQGFYFNYSTVKTFDFTYDELKKKTAYAFENAFKRLTTSLNNRPVALPLSGGYDSRLIAVMLKKNNYTNVTCYTYGKKGNHEIENSRRTANELGFKWIFIEYTDELLNNYINSDLFKQFTSYTCKHTSMPSLQGYFAVKHLTENNLISKDSIFIPGYAGDLLGGSQYMKVIPQDIKTYDISKLILKEKFAHNKINKETTIKGIEHLLVNFDSNYRKKLPATVFEDYDIKEKFSKIIFKTANLYTFFGYEHRFPFWDTELLGFFKDVPSTHKKVKYLYDDVLKNHFFNEFNVNFKTEIQPSLLTMFIQKIKESIKPFLPYFILKRYLLKNDWLNSEHITLEMTKSLDKNKLPYNSKVRVFNEFNIQWYLYFTRGSIK